MNWKDRKVIYISLIISVLLHVILLILVTDIDLFAFSRTPQQPEIQPLELVFEQPAPPPQPREQLPEKFYEIVENPNASGEKPENTDMLSTASSRSRAPVISPGQIRAVPGSESDQNQKKNTEEVSEEVREALEKSLLAYKENRSFSRSALTGEKIAQKFEGEEMEVQKGEMSRRPEGFKADLVGDFALSTYEWEWAPYWLKFKHKLNRVWYAPPAYYELGLISGHTILRFKVYRNGEMRDLQVLRQVGHQSLEQSSVSAIQAVFPFLPLPSNFPDEYLEVTLKMIYPDLREYYSTNKK
ncbi:MAG: hypothetical protein EH225_12045 [Calditrichaeota bacterium]|nr:energy transducer TonB [Calditrichota bacterium]RQV99171.1 MAG: hypothetical protein EH225_12045 [Calditrichota bacterium]